MNHNVLSGCLVKTPYSLINQKDRASVQFMVKPQRKYNPGFTAHLVYDLYFLLFLPKTAFILILLAFQ